jgi:hypothetical protein
MGWIAAGRHDRGPALFRAGWTNNPAANALIGAVLRSLEPVYEDPRRL